MNWQGYPESYSPQQSHDLSQEKSGPDVSGEFQDPTELAHYDTQWYSSGLYKEQAGVSASSESCPIRRGGRG